MHQWDICREAWNRWQTGNREYRITKEFESNEFIVLKDAFNRLMDEIMKLKIQSYEKQINLQETELKCIKLQIRPHFFLNAMTTISSLSQQGKNKEIEAIIQCSCQRTYAICSVQVCIQCHCRKK